MDQTVLYNRIQLLGEISESLAEANLRRTMPGWQKNELAREFRTLNALVGQQLQLHADPVRQSVPLRARWAHFAASQTGKSFGRRVLILYVIILISVVFSIIGYTMMGFGASR